MAAVIDGRQKGKSIEEVVQEAFAPKPQPEVSPEAQSTAGEAVAPGQAPSGEPNLPQGLQPSGRLSGVAPGQQGMAPGGRPALQTLLAGLSSSGQANLSAGVLRRQPV
jgi:hypothetical protein